MALVADQTVGLQVWWCLVDCVTGIHWCCGRGQPHLWCLRVCVCVCCHTIIQRNV